MALKRSAAAMEDCGLRAELAQLLGINVSKIGNIRKTENGQISVIDVVRAITGKGSPQAAKDVRMIQAKFKAVSQNLTLCQFPGERQRRTPVAALVDMVQIILLLPGSMAAAARLEASKLIVRFLGGDIGLVDEVRQMRHIQEELADTEPLHPLRAFGKAVEQSRERSSRELTAASLRVEVLELLATHQSQLLAAVAEIKEVARATIRICHVRGVDPKSSAALLALGTKLEGDEGLRINREEGMLSVSNCLAQHAGTYKKLNVSSFSRKLKALKLEKCRRDGTKPYLKDHIGDYRIAYMEVDRPLMEGLLKEMTAGQVVHDAPVAAADPEAAA